MKKGIFIAIAVMVMATALTAQAGSRKGLLGLSGAFDYATYSMSALNDTVESAGFNKITGGMGGGGNITYGLTSNVEIGLGVNYLATMVADKKVDDASGFVGAQTNKISAPALEVLALGSYIWPDVAKNMDVKATLGLGFVSMSGKADVSTAGGTVVPAMSSSTTLTASGFGALVGVGGEYFFSEQFALGLDLGYRYGSLKPVNTSSPAGSGTVTDASGNDVAADFGGLNVRVGANFLFDLTK